MNFKFKTYSALAAAAILGLASCANNEPAVGITSEGTEGDLFTTLTLNFGGGTRSATNSDDETGKGSSTDGEEIGTLEENNIDDILVVLCTKDEDGNYEHVTHAYANAVRKTNAPTNTPTYVVRFETQDLYPLAGNAPDGEGGFKLGDTSSVGEILYVFTYCNPTPAMKAAYTDSDGYDVLNPKHNTSDGTFVPDDQFTVEFNDDKGTYQDDERLWNDNHFVMTNANIPWVQLPSKYQLLYEFNKETTPFNLGTVTVQRAATRFDLAEKAATDDLAKNTYPIENPVNNTIDAYVTMDGVAFFNEAKNYYAFMHTSDNGKTIDSKKNPFQLCGWDRSGQYVVSPYWDVDSYPITTDNGTKFRGPQNFNYSMVDDEGKLIAPEKWNYTSYNDIIGGREDNNDTWNAGGTYRDYYFWTYSTPNTIPGIDYQIKGNTTGVLFRAFITANEEVNPALATAMNTGKIIYAYEGILYGDKDMLYEYVKGHPESQVQRIFKDHFTVTDNNGTVTVALNEDENTSYATKDLGNGGFSVYRPTQVDGKNVYYCYYYYYNRHNDNGNDTDMGQMEFAAVRNNVYKLFVATVKEFGHPGNPDDDENPEDPEDPDESPQTYFKVQVEVLPWVVRVNDINF